MSKCIYCQKELTTGDMDNLVCRACKDKQLANNPGEIRGWICPVCGRGLSPYTQMCPCQGYPPNRVTC